MGRLTGRVFVHRTQRIHFLQLLGIPWEGIIQIGPNRKDKVKMNKAAKRKEARMKRREERNNQGNGRGKEDGGGDGGQPADVAGNGEEEEDHANKAESDPDCDSD